MDEEQQDLTETLWVIVKAGDNMFGLDANHVGNMMVTPKITKLPNQANYMLGTITVRGDIIPLIDLRVYVGYKSILQENQEFCDMMDQRLQDHRNWIKELKASVDEEREFKLATNPHKCAFGKWYDNYKTGEMTINTVLKQFDKPHRAIHAIGIDVGKLVKNDKVEEAKQLIHKTENTTLESLVKLFAKIKEANNDIAHRRISMVYELDGKRIAFDIDEVVSVETIKSIQHSMASKSRGVDCDKIGKRDKDKSLVLLLERFDL